MAKGLHPIKLSAGAEVTLEHGKAFTPENLETDFGAESQLTRDSVLHLHNVLQDTGNANVITSLSHWKTLFCEIYGYNLDENVDKIRNVGDHYGLASASPTHLLFAVQTYYAIFLKLLTAEITSSFCRDRVSVLRRCIQATSTENLLHEMNAIEQGEFVIQLGLDHTVGRDPYGWYLTGWNKPIARVVGEMVRAMARYDFATLRAQPKNPYDLLKRLYQKLFPPMLRHALGEYYTPEWLAEFTLDELGYDGDPDVRVLDPSCGSGTFLVMAICRAKAWFFNNRGRCGYDERGLVERILRNVIGFDLNPLAVMTARINGLLCVRDLLEFTGFVKPSVYLVDSISAQAKASQGGSSLLSFGQFDYVVGNPPWINWEALPKTYRSGSERLWRDYDLLTLKGWKARVAAGRTDLSILFVVVCLQMHLKPHGKLAFVINQSIFKSTGGGEGFRKFTLRDTWFAPLKVHDFSGMTIFDDAVNRVCVAVFERDAQCTYPVSYTRWIPMTPRAVLAPVAARELRSHCRPEEGTAVPSVGANPASPWLTGTPLLVAAVSKVMGVGSYRAREGVNWGGALGVYQLATVKHSKDGKCLITNDASAGRIRFDEKTATVENTLVFPLVKGRDVTRWRSTPSRHILLPHAPGPDAANPIPLPILKRNYPNTFSYFRSFREPLAARKEYQRWGAAEPFYALYRVGPYTFAPFKVVFKDLSEVFQCCVISDHDGRMVIPDYTLRMIPFEDEDAAYFVAGLLNSSPASVALHATSVGVQTQRYHVGDIDKLAIPEYQRKSKIHRPIVELSKLCHAAAAEGRWTDISGLHAQLDEAVGELWSLGRGQLQILQGQFKEISGETSAEHEIRGRVR